MASSPTKAEPRRSNKHDAAVAEKLGGAMGRIRSLELIVGFCGLIVGFLVYGQVLAIVDVRFPLPEVVRQLLLTLFLVGAGFWAYLFIYRPIRYGINPYYAVQVIEENTPDSRNGMLNWLDLQATPETTAARGMVGQRAAREANKADLERAISGESATWFGAAAALLFLFGFIVALLVGPRSFLESLGRVFMPYSFAAVSPASTQITILRPDGGDGTILVGQAATITVQLAGRIPKVTDEDAARIRYRHAETEPWRELPLAALEGASNWEVVIPALEVENGFDYQITAGGTVTEVHRISVIAAPLIEEFRATYHFRQYTGRTFEVRRLRPIDAIEGTEVELLVKTNRTLDPTSPRFEAEVPTGRVVIAGTVVEDDPTAFRVKVKLEETGTYRITFASMRKDSYADVQSYPLIARPDEMPEVEVTHPARDVQLAANGMLTLEGWAADKEGLKSVVLRLQVAQGQKLSPQPYRGMDSLRQKHGTCPTYLKYRDQLDLTKLRDESGKPFKPEVGSKIEYWLEASDACDLPGKTHLVASKRYFVEVIEVDPNAMGQAEQREQAGKDQAEHEKKQDEALAQEDAARKEENDRKEQAGNQDQPGENNPGNEGNEGANNQGNAGNKPDPSNPMDGNQGNAGNQGEKKDEQNTLNQAEQIKNALEKKEQGENKPGQAKEQNQEQGGESKQGGEGEQKAESKEGANGEQKEQAGKGKEEGKEGMKGQEKPAEGKQGGQQGMGGMGENKPEGKEGGQQQGMGMNPAGEQKPGEQAGEGKPGQGRERKEGTGSPSERKESPEPGKEQAAQGKDANGQGQQAGEMKESPANPQPAEGKEGGEKGMNAAPPTGKQPPSQGSQTPGGENKQGDRPEPGQPEQQGQTQGATSKPGGERRDLKDPREARAEDVEALKKQPAEPGANGSDAAGKELERIQKEAKDPQVREAARQALEERKEKGPPGAGKKPGENKPGQEAGMGMGMNEPNPQPGEKKPGGEQGMPGGAGGKPEPGMGQTMGEKAEVKEGTPEGMGGMGGMPTPGENAPSGKNMGKAPATGGQPGMGVDPATGMPPGMGQNGPGENIQPEKAVPTPPTELQLRKFKDAVTPDVLKDLRMSPEEFERFLKKYEELTKRPGSLRDPLPPSQPGSGSLPALGGTPRTGTTPGSNPATGPGTITRPQVPPGYREAYSEFLRELAKPERP